jgi:hypothetical protein
VLLPFARSYVVRPLTYVEAGATVAASVVMASLSWRFIEAPFRGRQGMGSRSWIFSRAAAASLALGAYGAVALLTGGAPDRSPSNSLSVLSSSTDAWEKRCDGSLCRIGPADTAETFILWGDSHARALAPVAERVALANHRSGFVAFQAGCAPLLGLKRYDLERQRCGPINDAVLARAEANHIRTIVLHARWGLYAEGTRYKSEVRGGPLLLTASRRVEDNYAVLDTLLRGTLAELRRRRLNAVIIASVPEIGIDVTAALAPMRKAGSLVELAPRYPEFMSRQSRAFQLLRRAATDYGALLVYPHEVFCDLLSCSVVRDGRVLYRDDNHLSSDGAMYLAPMFERLLNPPIRTAAH